jgi:hypothetical protein
MFAVMAAALTGCGPSQAEIDAKRREEVKACMAAHNLKVSERKASCDTAKRDAESQVREARQLVIDGVSEVGREGRDGELVAQTGWSITIKELTRNQWRWTEREADMLRNDVHAALTVDIFEYSVNPGDLEPTFQITTYRDWPAVQMRCRDEKDCIRVRGVTETGETVYETTNRTQIDERQNHNNWPVGSNSASGRVAQALTDLVKVQFLSEPEICTPLPEPAC